MLTANEILKSALVRYLTLFSVKTYNQTKLIRRTFWCKDFSTKDLKTVSLDVFLERFVYPVLSDPSETRESLLQEIQLPQGVDITFDLQRVQGPDFVASLRQDNISARIVRAYVIAKDEFVCRIDFLHLD